MKALSQEEDLKREIEYQLGRLNSFIQSNNGSMHTDDKIKTSEQIQSLRARLDSISQQKSYSSLMEQIANSIKETLSKANIYQGIYSGNV